MKEVQDKFSHQSFVYKKFRPTYPIELFEFIYSFCSNKSTAWDCGTGNGQVALILGDKFDQVYATDISEKQIQNAARKENIFYSIERAEKTSFPENSIDLITVAQAIHWFDLPAFNQEAGRVLKPGGVVAIWGYGMLEIDAETDQMIQDFYHNMVGKYWDKERKHIENRYESIPFDFEEVNHSQKFQIKAYWTPEQLSGYLNSWSSVQNYIRQNDGENPVNELMGELSNKWDTGLKEVAFPIFLRIGRNKK